MERIKIFIGFFIGFHILGWTIASFVAWEWQIFFPIEDTLYQPIARVFMVLNFIISFCLAYAANIKGKLL